MGAVALTSDLGTVLAQLACKNMQFRAYFLFALKRTNSK